MKPFHETTTEEREGLTVVQIMERYAQPDWCDYHEALAGAMGCWSLLSKPNNITPEFCMNCECCKTTLTKSE